MNTSTNESNPGEGHVDQLPAVPEPPSTAATKAAREPKIAFEIKKEGKHFGLHVEGQLVAVTVYRRGAATMETLLRNLVKFSGRRLFRTALEEALTAPSGDVEEAKAGTKEDSN